MQDPVGVEIVDAVQDLVEERLDHVPGNVDLLTFGLARSVELDDMLQERKNESLIQETQYFYCIVPKNILTHKSCSAKSNNSQTLRSGWDRKTFFRLITFGCLSSRSSCNKKNVG